MPRSSGLGKGLSSIIPGAELDKEAARRAAPARRSSRSPCSSVSPNPNQPRVHFDEESLLELSASIAEMGVLQPILVRPLDDGDYELDRGGAAVAGAHSAPDWRRSRRSCGPPTTSARSNRRSSRTCTART